MKELLANLMTPFFGICKLAIKFQSPQSGNLQEFLMLLLRGLVGFGSYSVLKFSELAWLVLKQRPLKCDGMVRLGMGVDLGGCLCHSNAESHEHIFSSCY